MLFSISLLLCVFNAVRSAFLNINILPALALKGGGNCYITTFHALIVDERQPQRLAGYRCVSSDSALHFFSGNLILDSNCEEQRQPGAAAWVCTSHDKTPLRRLANATAVSDGLLHQHTEIIRWCHRVKRLGLRMKNPPVSEYVSENKITVTRTQSGSYTFKCSPLYLIVC